MKSKNSGAPAAKTLYTKLLTSDQAQKLDSWLDRNLWIPYDVQYAKFAYKDKFTNVVCYNSG